MRSAAAGVLFTLALASGGPALAQEYPWCAQYGGGRGGGGTNCGFSTIEQCRAAISGNGGFCRENLFYHGPHAEYSPPVRHSRKRVHHHQ